MTPVGFDVLHLSFWPPDQPGSYNRSIDRFLRSPSAAGHALFTSGPSRALDAEIADRVHFSSGRAHSLTRTRVNRFSSFTAIERYTAHQDPDLSGYAADAVRFVRQRDPAVVVVYDDVRLCLQLARARRRPYALVLSQHGTTYGLPPEISDELYDPARLDGVIVLSTAARDLIVAEDAARGLRVDVLPNAVDTERFRPPSDDERTAARAGLGLGPGPVVGFVGRLNAHKGLDHAMEALAAIRPRVPGAQLLIAGGGTEAFERGLTERAEAPDLAGAVVFAGRLGPDDVRRAYWASDVFVFPTLVPEGMPLVVLEALACGVPVAGYEFAAAGDIAGDADGLVVVPKRDRTALASSLEALVSDPAMRATIGARARDVAVRRFSIGPWCAAQAAVLEAHLPDHERTG